MACYASCNGQPPPPPPPQTCQERCELLKAELLQKCALGSDPAAGNAGELDPECVAEAERTAERCLQNCVEPPPPEPTCEDRCARLADELKAKCIREDGSVDDNCLARVAAMVEGCYAACAAPPPPQEPTCDELCRAKAEEAAQECLSQNLPDVDCRARYHRVLQACLGEQCTTTPPEESTCETRCARHSREVYDLCQKEGGSAEACRERAAQAYQRCAAACSDDPTVPPGGGDQGGTVSCDEGCVEQAEAIFKTCVEAGGTEDECRVRSDAILGLCLERCSGEAPCESYCALAAQVVVAACSWGGMTSEECRRMANMVLERCVGLCAPAPTCSDRCAAIQASAVRECLARGGSEEECAAKGAEVAAACAERCNGAPVPSCDAQCEEKAASMVEEWVAQGLSREEIASLRDNFLEECKALLGENCVEEAKADLTIFRTFRRGDANRDGAVDISDPVATLAWLFTGGRAPSCEDAADANDDGTIDISDPVTSLGCLFLGKGSIPEPHEQEGQDPTSDSLVCAE